MDHERKSLIFILCACFLWVIDLLVRYPITLKLSYVSIVFLESLVGLFFAMPLMAVKVHEIKKLNLKEWGMAIFIGGIGMSVAGYLQTACIQKATPGLFSFFQIFQPVFVIYLAHSILREKVDSMYVYWGSWVILSAILMFSVDLELMLGSSIIFSDIFIALLTMLIWGLCTILAKLFLKRHSALTLVGLRWVFAFIFSSVILFLEGEGLPFAALNEPTVLVRFIFIGAVAGVFSMSLYYTGLKQLSPGKVSFMEISYAAFGMIFSALYTFETLSFFQLLGAISFFAFIIFFISRQDSQTRSVPTS